MKTVLISPFVLFAAALSAQEVTPENIAANAAQCYAVADTFEAKRACIGAEQDLCAAGLISLDTGSMSELWAAESYCGAAELDFWFGQAERELEATAALFRNVDEDGSVVPLQERYGENVENRLFDAAVAWKTYAFGQCDSVVFVGLFSQVDVPSKEICLLQLSGLRTVELWQAGEILR